jgi:hypothetical protein
MMRARSQIGALAPNAELKVLIGLEPMKKVLTVLHNNLSAISQTKYSGMTL